MMVDASRSPKPNVLVTGCSGLIGTRIIDELKDDYTILGLDLQPVSDRLASQVEWIKCDLTDDNSVSEAIESIRGRVGDHLASVVHLAAYYDFSGQPSPLYQELTVEGTKRLLNALKKLNTQPFIFSSSLLVMESTEEDVRLTEASPVEGEWDYPSSKLAAERAIQAVHGDIPAVILRIAGVYDEDCHSIPLSQQISRIDEKQLESYFFPGDKEHGQAFIHLDDVASCFRKTIERRDQLGEYEVFLIGEEDVMSYDELQDEIGKLLHEQEWPTIRIPKPVAKAGAWAKDQLASDEEHSPFIKPWMIDLADQNYPLNTQKAREQLDWRPRHTLRTTLPEIIGRLRTNRRRWYEINGLPVPDTA